LMPAMLRYSKTLYQYGLGKLKYRGFWFRKQVCLIRPRFFVPYCFRKIGWKNF
jgi:hypothetical protein